MTARVRRSVDHGLGASTARNARYLYEVEGLGADDRARSRPTSSPTRARWR